ncbi:MAG: YbgA family protein [Desulfatibacillaceae bacterium]
MTTPLRIGISTCLLGEPVRYDGGHKHDRYLTGTLGQYVEYVPVCPEVECGLGVPRESMRLVGKPQNPRLVTSRSGVDLTERMQTWADKRVEELAGENLCGFIFKSKSPSSGMARVPVYTEQGQPVRRGSGIFAKTFMERFPLIPVEEDGRLNDPGLRENFIVRIFALRSYRQMLEENPSRGGLVDFHTRHKLLILSHSQEEYRALGKLVARAKELSGDELFAEYESRFMRALSLLSTPKKHANVLQHMMGYFKKDLSSDEKQELLEVLDQYRDGTVPLVVPLVLIKHYVRKYDQPYLKEQVYLSPNPLEMALRNHV